ncbi:MAG: DUF2336 domain-containing protein [Rhodospirillales bacterium]|nr:DUF2336 domain-containing protein [Rhodospirillales bacterium]
MAHDFSHLENLARMAKETEAGGRQELLRDVTDMFMGSPPDALNETEVQYFGDIMGKLAFEMEMQVRQHLSETLAAVASSPRELICRLAGDEIDVARHVLMKSEVLQDADLLEIISQCGQKHLMAITVRPQVSAQVSDAIVEKGNDEVLGSLAGNAGAALSNGALQTLVQRSEGGNLALQEQLVLREGLPQEVLEKLYKHVSGALKEHIMSLGVGVGGSEIDEMLAEAGDWLGAKAKGGSSPAEKFIDRKAALKQLDPDLLVKLMHDGKMSEFTAGLARLAKIEVSTVRLALADKSGEKLAVICKSLEMDTNMFSEVVDIMGADGQRSAKDKATLIGVYGRITAESAQRAMRFLRTRQKLSRN